MYCKYTITVNFWDAVYICVYGIILYVCSVKYMYGTYVTLLLYFIKFYLCMYSNYIILKYLSQILVKITVKQKSQEVNFTT